MNTTTGTIRERLQEVAHELRNIAQKLQISSEQLELETGLPSNSLLEQSSAYIHAAEIVEQLIRECYG